jgi:hypothetical protein
MLTGMIWFDNFNLALSHSMVKISDDFFWENKIKQAHQWSYHLPKPYVAIKVKPSTYACLWPVEFCQIVVTLGRIFSCSHDRDHVHPHIHANSQSGSYEKTCHPSKINTPSSKEFSSWKRRNGSLKKRKNAQRSIEKCAPNKEHRK